MALTEEERRSVEEEKQVFLNEIGLSAFGLKTYFTVFNDYVIREDFAFNDEHRKSIQEARSRYLEIFLDGIPVKKSIPPAA